MHVDGSNYSFLLIITILCILGNFSQGFIIRRKFLLLLLATKCFYSVKTCKVKSAYFTEKDCSVPRSLSQSEISRELSRDFFMCIKSTAEARKGNGEVIITKLRLGITEQEYKQEFGYGRGSGQNSGLFRVGSGSGIDSVFSMNSKKNKNNKDKDKKCNAFPVKAVPRKVMDHFIKYSESSSISSITNVQACACRSNYCNSAKISMISHLHLCISVCATVLLYFLQIQII